MKFFQKPGVAVTFTVLMIAAALFIGLFPALKSGAETTPVQTVSSQEAAAQEQPVPQTPASEQTDTASTANTAAEETISYKYIRDDAGLFTRSGEGSIKSYDEKIYAKTGSHVAILTTADTGGMTITSYANSAFDAMGLSEYDMLFAIDTASESWYVTTGAYVADYADSKLESIFRTGFTDILDSDADNAVKSLYQELYSWCKSTLNGSMDTDYEPVQQTQRVRRKSVIGTIITILIIFWIIKAIFGSGRRGGGGGGGGGGGFWSGLFLGSLFSNHHHHGPGPGPGPRPGPRPGPKPGGFGGGPRPGGGSRGGFGGGRGGFGGGRR